MPSGTHEILMTRQRHEAERMGLHYDYRLVLGDKAYSWATKKELPEDGKPILLYEQPVHDRDYALSKKVIIPSGNYGAGVTTLDWARKAKAIKDGDKIIIDAGKHGKYLLKHVPSYEPTAWIFRRIDKSATLEKKASTSVQESTNRYLEKIAITLELYYHKATKKNKWFQPGQAPEGWISKEVRFHKAKKQGPTT